MILQRRQFSKAFKLRVLHEIELGKPAAEAAREHHVHPNTIWKWRKLYRSKSESAFTEDGRVQSDDAHIAAL